MKSFFVLVFLVLVTSTSFANGEGDEGSGSGGVRGLSGCNTTTRHFSGDIKPNTVNELRNIILPCIEPGAPGTFLSIISEGGHATTAMALYDTFGIYGDRSKLTTIAIGRVASAAVAIFLSGGKRQIACHATLFLHPASVSVSESSIDRGRLHEISASIIGDTDAYIRVIRHATGLSRDDVQVMLTGRSLSAQEAVELGFAHEIIGC